MPDSGTRAPTSKIRLSSDFAESANAHELRSQALAATIAPDKDASIVLSASQQAKRELQGGGTNQEKQYKHERLTLTLLEQARQLSEQLERRITMLENAFKAEMGDAWREEIANKVMEPDAVPQRRERETMPEYRARLEEALIATMIDPATGAIKPEYADDPDTARYAQWAQAQHQKREVDAKLETGSEAAFAKDADWLDLKFAEESASSRPAAITSTTDARSDSAADLSSEQSAFPPPTA